MSILLNGSTVDTTNIRNSLCPFCGLLLPVTPEVAGATAQYRGECSCGYRYILVPTTAVVLQVRPGTPHEWREAE